MNFKDFSQQVSKIKDLPLPGETSHFKMAPEFRVAELKLARLKRKNPKKAAVLALFYPDEQNVSHLLLILRKTYKGVHSNQIGLPGGKVEETDDNLEFTALRETHEEVGVSPEKVTIIRALSEIYIPPSNFEVQPFIGISAASLSFLAQESEVEEIVEVTVSDFLDDSNLFSQRLSTSYAENVDVPAFKLNEHVVWGATAMMLSEIKELLNQVL